MTESSSSSLQLYLASFFISASVHLGVKVSTETIESTTMATHLWPTMQTGLITLMAIFVSKSMITVPADPLSSSNQKMRDEPEEDLGEREVQEEKEQKKMAAVSEERSGNESRGSGVARASPKKSKKGRPQVIDSSPPESPTKLSDTRGSFNFTPASPAADSRRSFKKDKEVDKLRKRISELENERRTLEKKHSKRLQDRENELQLQHAEEQERVTREYKEERERVKREQRDEIEGVRSRVLAEVQDDVRKRMEKECQDRIEREVARAKDAF